MKKRIAFLLFSIMLITGFFLWIVRAYHDDITTFQVDVYGAFVMSVSAPDAVFLGNVSKGAESARSGKIYINNTGTVNVTVTPLLVSADPIFSYLYFQRRVADSFKRIGNFSFNISAASTFGDYESEYFYAKLDLRNFNGNIPYNISGYKADVKFFVAEQA